MGHMKNLLIDVMEKPEIELHRMNDTCALAKCACGTRILFAEDGSRARCPVCSLLWSATGERAVWDSKDLFGDE